MRQGHSLESHPSLPAPPSVARHPSLPAVGPSSALGKYLRERDEEPLEVP